MNVYDIVAAAAKLDLQSADGLTDDDIQKLPPGWQPMVKRYFEAVQTLHGKVVHLFYSKGTLQAEALAGTPEQDKVLEWLSRGMTRNTAAVCMVSGKYGRRRHYYRAWPCLADEFDSQFAHEAHAKEGYDAFEKFEAKKGS